MTCANLNVNLFGDDNERSVSDDEEEILSTSCFELTLHPPVKLSSFHQYGVRDSLIAYTPSGEIRLAH